MNQITQLTDQVFLFPYIEQPSVCQYGDMPSWDNSGATSHLMPINEIVNKEEYNWIIKNKILYEIVAIDHGRKMKHLRFINKEDAMAFKLRWI